MTFFAFPNDRGAVLVAPSGAGLSWLMLLTASPDRPTWRNLRLLAMVLNNVGNEAVTSLTLKALLQLTQPRSYIPADLSVKGPA
jgi:predicted ABC-type transport system involved in lysophospholipase L1 biosynthesis ATPase subunit